MNAANKITVLLVDDDEDAFLYTRHLLSKVKNQPYHLDWIDNYQEALAAINAQRHQLYLLDYRLGDYDGLELLQAALASGCQAPFIFLTGQDDTEIDLAAMELGAADYLAKHQLNTSLLERSMRYALKEAQTLAALRESDKRYALAVGGSRDGIWDWDLRTNRVYYSPRWKTMLGWAENQIGDSPADWFRLLHPNDIARFQQAFQQHQTGAVPHFEVEYRLLQPNGTYCWVLGRGLVERDKTGKVYRIAGSQTDINERKQFEVWLETEKERLSITIGSMGDGVITTDTAGRVVFLNRSAEILSGWTITEALGKPISEVFRLVDAKTRQPLPDMVGQVLELKQVKELDEPVLLIANNGTEYSITDSIAPVHDKQGCITGAVVVFRDVTHQQKLAQELFRSSKLESVGVLAGGIAHDFNNLLTGILGNISLIRLSTEDTLLSQELAPLLEAAEGAIDRARLLTNQLLTFARGGAPVKKLVQAQKALQQALETALPNLPAANVRVEAADDLGMLELDTVQFNQVIQNLLFNAIEAMSKPGLIRLAAMNKLVRTEEKLPLSSGKYIQITIEDQGEGIPSAYLERIFEPYFTTKPGGRGLGLATCYAIIKKHNGHIIVRSRPHEGATFDIYLPVAEPPIVKTSRATPIPGDTLYILVVDDDIAIRHVTGKILENLGHKVVTTADGAEALELYHQAVLADKPFDLVITDLLMPLGISGKELAEKLLPTLTRKLW
jgi:PAS domain S-box-containing protein